MKFSLIILALFFLNNCSFDNKSGIWNNEKGFKSSDKSLFSEFKTLSVIDNSFYEILPINKDFKFRNFKKIKNSQWKDYYCPFKEGKIEPLEIIDNYINS